MLHWAAAPLPLGRLPEGRRGQAWDAALPGRQVGWRTWVSFVFSGRLGRGLAWLRRGVGADVMPFGPLGRSDPGGPEALDLRQDVSHQPSLSV